MTDKALLMGINNYASISDLRGCENDVHSMARLLTDSFGFHPANIRQYLSAEVTRQTFAAGFDWLLQGAQAGDRLVLHFSGHGSYLQRDENEENGDEPIDELICLYDMDFDDPESYLVDDDLGHWVARVPAGVRLTVVLDTCHSGTGTRLVNFGRSAASAQRLIKKDTAKRAAVDDSRKLERQLTRGTAAALENLAEHERILARVWLPKEELAVRGSRSPIRKFGRSLTGARSAELNHQLLAAAADIETAADAYIENDFHGAFTYYLCEAARASAPQATVQQVMDATLSTIHNAGFAQTPQNEGPFLDDPLFGPVVNPAPEGEGATDEYPAGVQPTRPVATGSEPVGGASSVELLAQMLRVAEKYLDLADYIVRQPPARAPLVPRVARVGMEAIVYVHGISRHVAGYSLPWWNALCPHLSGSPDRHEVLWSPVVNPKRIRSAVRARSLAEEEFVEQLEMLIEDRQQQLLATAPLASRAAVPAPVASLRGAGFSFDDFARYMYNQEEREEILGIFDDVVRPLLKEGITVHLVSHSWGTVVAWEGLRRLDGAALAGRVANLFVVGSALSLGPVKLNLRQRVGDLARPAVVDHFYNLDARGDIVGGPLDHKFGVDQEFLGLDSRNCFIFDISCAHGSYFQADNLAVNRDIFAKLINP